MSAVLALLLTCPGLIAQSESKRAEAEQVLKDARLFLSKVRKAGKRLPAAQQLMLEKQITAAEKHCDKGEKHLEDNVYPLAVTSINKCTSDAEKAGLSAGLALRAGR